MDSRTVTAATDDARLRGMGVQGGEYAISLYDTPEPRAQLHLSFPGVSVHDYLTADELDQLADAVAAQAQRLRQREQLRSAA